MSDNGIFLNNEDGSAIVIALMVLMVVTIIGISSSNKTTVELQIVRNEGIYKENLYLAEGGAQEAIQRIWNISREDPFLLEKRAPVWLNDDSIDMENINNWDNDGADDDDTSFISSLDADARFTAVDVGISRPGSLEMTGTNVHDFAIYGLSEHNDGRVFIQIGYRERF